MGNFNNVLETKNIFKLFGIPVSNSIFMMWIIMAVIIVAAYIFTRNLKKVPEGKQNIIEMVVEFINNFVKDIIGHHWKSFAPYLGSLLLFLFTANIVALFNIIPSSEQLFKWTGVSFFNHIPEIVPPTKDYNITAAFGVMTIVLILGAAVRFKGVSGWAKGLLKPMPMMLPFNLLDYGTRFLSLSFRLFGNILSAYVLVELLYGVLSPVVPLVGIVFDLFDGVLQAYIFVFLTSIYIAEAVE